MNLRLRRIYSAIGWTMLAAFAAIVIAAAVAPARADCYGRSRTAFTSYGSYSHGHDYNYGHGHGRSYSYWPGGYWYGQYWAPGNYYTSYPYEAHVDHFYFVDNSYRDVLLLTAIRSLLSEAKGGAASAPVAPVRPATVAAPRTGDPYPMPPADAGTAKAKWADVPGRFQNEKLLAVVNTSCVRCHGPTKAERGLSLVTSDGKALAKVPRVYRQSCALQSLTGDMPKNGTKVDDAAVGLFVEWAKEEDE